MEYTIINNVSRDRVPKWGNKKKYIAIHYLGVVGQNHELMPDGSGAHFYIYWDGSIHQRCSLDAIPWAVGTAGYYTQKHPYARNANTISIEMCCKCDGNSANADDPKWYFTQETQEACVWLVKKLMKDLGIPAENVLRHYDIVNKVCPAPYVHNNRYKTSWTWDEFKSKLTRQISTSGTQAAEFLGLTEKQAADKLLEIAVPIARKYGLLPSVLAGQSALESGHVRTELAQKGNNILGMKADLLNNTWDSPTWDGKSVVKILTTEYYNNVEKQVYDNFRKYACIEDCMKDRCAFFLNAKVSKNAKKAKYDGIAECKNYVEQITLIKSRGYATDPGYIDKVCNIIERYDLARYDDEKTLKKKTYIVQAGAFNVKTNAEKLVKRIKAAGLPAILKSAEGTFNVQCGVFGKKENANALVQKLKERGFDAIIK